MSPAEYERIRILRVNGLHASAAALEKKLGDKFMKYIKHSVAGIIVFPASRKFTHEDVALALRARLGGETISAGFVDFIGTSPVCYGRSESLNLDSDPGDTAELLATWGLVTQAASPLPI